MCNFTCVSSINNRWNVSITNLVTLMCVQFIVTLTRKLIYEDLYLLFHFFSITVSLFIVIVVQMMSYTEIIIVV